MARHGTRDYATTATAGFLLGLVAFAFGATGELVGHAVFGSLPAWEETLFFYAEAGGLLVGFTTPWIFGVLLPLIE